MSKAKIYKIKFYDIPSWVLPKLREDIVSGKLPPPQPEKRWTTEKILREGWMGKVNDKELT